MIYSDVLIQAVFACSVTAIAIIDLSKVFLLVQHLLVCSNIFKLSYAKKTKQRNDTVTQRNKSKNIKHIKIMIESVNNAWGSLVSV